MYRPPAAQRSTVCCACLFLPSHRGRVYLTTPTEQPRADVTPHLSDDPFLRALGSGVKLAQAHSPAPRAAEAQTPHGSEQEQPRCPVGQARVVDEGTTQRTYDVYAVTPNLNLQGRDKKEVWLCPKCKYCHCLECDSDMKSKR